MKMLIRLFPLFFAAISTAWATPLPESTVEQAAAKIDQLLAADLTRAKLSPTPITNDATFLRRAYLGIVGRIPSANEARAFLDDQATDKREILIDRLVASPGFDSHLFNWTADLLRVQTRQENFGLGWHVWLRKALAADKPWNSLVSEMLGATGDCTINPAVGYYLRDRNMQLDNFSNTMQVFLGRQIGCAQCHDHPFDDWSQYEYYEMAAFGGGIQYRSGEAEGVVKRITSELAKDRLTKAPAIPIMAKTDKKNGRGDQAAKQQIREQQKITRSISNQIRPVFKELAKNAIIEDPDSVLRLPADYQYHDAKPGDAVKPATLFGTKVTDVSPEQRRSAFAAWVVSPENPYFTKTIANRLWHRTFGQTLLGSADDLKDDSESFHPELMTYLEDTMKGAGYDLRQFLRILYRTRLFQRECQLEEPVMGEPLAFRGPILTRMSAEQLHDSFLVLSQGEVADAMAPTLEKSWDLYRLQVHNLLHAETRDLLVLAESAKQAEELVRKAQMDQRDAQKQLSEATTPEARKKAQTAVQDAKNRIQAAKRQTDPLKSMQMGQGGGKNGGKVRATMLRASEMPAPIYPGSLVREFGGSDRQTPSSGNTEATIPQALALLNSPKTDIIAGRKSFLGGKLISLENPADRLEFLFLSLFGERPTDDERQLYVDELKDPNGLRDLASAMLTSNRFIFIQ